MLCIENQEESDYQWSGINTIMTERIRLSYLLCKIITNNSRQKVRIDVSITDRTG